MRKITENDLKGKGNVGRPDIPGVSTAEMQRIMDELAREVIVPAFNELSTETESAINERYTKAETQALVNQRVVDIGTGDMARAVYDPKDQGADIAVQLYTCTKTGTVYELTGSGAVGRCKIPEAWASGDTWTVNGEAVPAYCGADAVDGDCIVEGRWVLFTFDGTRLDFNGGGGLSESKLAQATAAEKYTLRNRTFYAGGKALRTGTLPNLSIPKSAGGDAVTGLNSEYPQVGVDVTTTYWYTTNMDGTKRLCLRPHFGAFGGDAIELDSDGYVGIDAATLGNAVHENVLEGTTFTSAASGSVASGGTMPNRSGWSASLAPGGYAGIPRGFHDGNGGVSAMSIKTKTVNVGSVGGSRQDYTYNVTEGTLIGITALNVSHWYDSSTAIVNYSISGNTIIISTNFVGGATHTISFTFAYY